MILDFMSELKHNYINSYHYKEEEMTFLKKFLLLGFVLFAPAVAAWENEENLSRAQRADQVFEELFRAKRSTSRTDPEFMEILQQNIFGEVFDIGDLSNKDRELITVAVLTTMQTLPQLEAHIGAALNAGNTPLEIRETIYQCAPFIGFPRTLNAVDVFNRVMEQRGIKLPLENATTVTEKDRYAKGEAIQNSLYGSEVKTAMRALPGIYKEKVPDMLTTFCFSDFYTRKGLTIKQRELLSLVVLTTLGAEKQLTAHIIGAQKAGNSRETLLAAMMQAMPYIGMPNALTAVNLIKDTDFENYKPIYGE